VFGKNGSNFVKTMLRLGQERKEVRVVCDQVGSPTYTYDLAKLLCEMIQTDKYGIYHATNEEYCSWYEFACEIFKTAGMDVKVIPIKSDEYPTKAKRPKNSRLSKKMLKLKGFNLLPHWRDALERYIKHVL
jgi:dTDP-4-dehydrorhamnose reductase